jgi:hypothetical protein
MNEARFASIVEDLNSPVAETQVLGLQLAMQERIPIDRLREPLHALLHAPTGDTRWLAVKMLSHAIHRDGADASAFLPALESLSSDTHRASWAPAAWTVGELAIGVTVQQWIGTGQWGEVLAMAQGGVQQMKGVLRNASSRRGEVDLSPLLPLLESALAHAEPEARGLAAKALTSWYAWKDRWSDVEPLLRSSDYAVRWYALTALDDAAEAGVDVSAILTALLEVLSHPNEELEKDRNVGYTQTLREAAANVLVWHMGKALTSRKPFVIEGVDLKQIPEVRAAIREIQSIARQPR